MRGRPRKVSTDDLFNLLYKLGGGFIGRKVLMEKLHISHQTLSRLKLKLVEEGRLAYLSSSNQCCYFLIDDRLALIDANRLEQSLRLRKFRRYVLSRRQLQENINRQLNADGNWLLVDEVG